jgi:hypothetical protein
LEGYLTIISVSFFCFSCFFKLHFPYTVLDGIECRILQIAAVCWNSSLCIAFFFSECDVTTCFLFLILKIGMRSYYSLLC